MCRQFHREGNNLLWATNTFSFDSFNRKERSRALVCFLQSLSLTQQKSLQSLELHIQVDCTYSDQQISLDEIFMEDHSKILSTLAGLKKITLHIRPRMFEVSLKLLERFVQDFAADHPAERPVLGALRKIGLAQLTVTIQDSHAWFPVARWPYLTADQRARLTSELRSQILSPE